MGSKQRPERLKLLIDPKERGIFGVRETASGPGIGAERRSGSAHRAVRPWSRSALPRSPPRPRSALSAARTPSGAYVVQLAALRARNGTRPAWARLQRAHPMLLGDRELTVQEITLGERGIFYRVQAGFFPDRAGASALCRALKARQQDCLVVKR